MGVLISSAVVLSTTNEIDSLEGTHDQEIFRAVGGMMVTISAIGIIAMVISMILRLLYFVEIIVRYFNIFGATVSFI